MKRPVRHILFWLVYTMQDALLHFTWMEPFMKTTDSSREILYAIATSLILLPAKLLAAYYFIFIGLQKQASDKKHKAATIMEMFVVLVLSLLLFRTTFNYIVMPTIYSINYKAGFLDPRDTLIAILEIGYITGLAITFKLLRLRAAAREKEKNMLKEKLETELKFLRNQTNPHFLFNTLNNIYALARKKSERTAEVVMKLSELLSFMLYESGKDTIAVAEEIRMMEDYIDLEKLRYTDRLSVTFRKEIDDPAQAISPLLLLPLIENAFKHGASETRFDSFIRIAISLRQGNLQFHIENNAAGEKRPASGNKIGLYNLQRQLELMYKEHSMRIENETGIFSVRININLNSYAKV